MLYTLNCFLKTSGWVLYPQFFPGNILMGAVLSLVSWTHPDGCCSLNCFLKISWWVLYPQLFPKNILMGAVPPNVSWKHPDGCCTLNSWKLPDGCCTLDCFLKTSWWVLYSYILYRPFYFPSTTFVRAVKVILSSFILCNIRSCKFCAKFSQNSVALSGCKFSLSWNYSNFCV